MKLLLILALTVVAALAEPSYFEYQKQFNKSYANGKEYTLRQAIYNENVLKIREHNAKYAAGDVTYSMGINQFTDMTEEEFQAYISRGNNFQLTVYPETFLI